MAATISFGGKVATAYGSGDGFIAKNVGPGKNATFLVVTSP